MIDERKRRSNRRWIVGIVLIFAVLFGCAPQAISKLSEVQNPKESRKAIISFKDIEEKAKLTCRSCGIEGKDMPYRWPYIRGKVLAVDKISGGVDSRIMKKISPDIRATKPEEVETMICVGNLEETRVETCTTCGKIVQVFRSRDVCIYDIVENRPISFRTIKESPKDTIDNQLISIIEGFPRK